MDYKKAYTTLFNEITTATRELESSRVLTNELFNCVRILKEAQQMTEDMYIESEPDEA